MDDLKKWHVLRDPETGQRSCRYYDKDALMLREDGEIGNPFEGKEEVPYEEWTDKEACEILTGCMALSGMERLKALPEIILKAMESSGLDGAERVAVLREIMNGIPEWHPR